VRQFGFAIVTESAFPHLTAPDTSSAGSWIDLHLHLMSTAPQYFAPRLADTELDAGGHRAANDPL